MPKLPKPKLSYSVIFDTNAIIGELPIKSEVIKLIEGYKDHSEVELNYFFPKVVAEEFKSKLIPNITGAKAAYGKAVKQINGLMGPVLSDKQPFFSDKEVLEAGEKMLEKYGIKILDTPGIALETMLKKAVNHEPPFSPVGDAGFKDTVIAETLKEHSPGLSNCSEVVFICGDAYFKEYIESIAEEYKFKVYKSVEEFESELKLRILLSGEKEKIVNSLAKEAELIFFKDEDKETLFYKEVWGKLNRTFPTLFSNPQPLPNNFAARFSNTIEQTNNSGNWYPVNKATYDIFKPLFIGKRDPNILIWESIIVYSQEFEKQVNPSPITGSLTLWREIGTYTLKFRVKWSIRLNKQGRLDINTAEVIETDSVKESGYYPYIPEFGYPPQTNISGPTTLSGTVTITEPPRTE